MYTVTQTEMSCLNVSVPGQQQMDKEAILRLATALTQEAKNLIAQNKLFYICCNNINYFPYPVKRGLYTTLYGEIEHFIYKSMTSEGDAFISLLKNQIYPAEWACTILLRELYVTVVMQNCQLSERNHQQLIEIINDKLKHYEESISIFGGVGSPIEDSTAKMLLSVYGYLREGNKLTKEYMSQKVH